MVSHSMGSTYKSFDSNNKTKVIIVSVVAMLLLAFYALVDPMALHWMPQCPFKALTGWQCPGCGNQRLVHTLLQGKIVEAISYNYFMLFAAPYLLLFLVRELLPKGYRREWLTAKIENRHVVRFYIVLFFGWLIIRNIWHL